MLLFATQARPMISARFEFKPDYAASFIEGGNCDRNIIELAFEDIDSLVSTVKSLENALKGCTAIVDGKVVALQKMPGESPP